MTDEVVNKVLEDAIETFRRQSRRAEYKTNPRAWAKDYLGIDLWSKQEDMFNAVLTNDHVAVRSCHGSGKSFNAALVACWWISTHEGEDAIVVSTAPTYPQVHSILWENIRKFHAMNADLFAQGKAPAKLPGYVTMGDKWISDAGEELGFGRKPADNNLHGFQGIHRRYVLVLIDEACGIKENLYTAVEAITTTQDSVILAIGNPDDPATQFNKFFNSLSKDSPKGIWFGIDISSFDSPNFTKNHAGHYDSCNHPEEQHRKWCQERKWAERWDRDNALNLDPNVLAQLPNHEWVNQRRAEWGEDSPLWQSKVLGKFPDQSVNTLFSRETINRGWDTVVKPSHNGKTVLGVDLARFGPDFSTVYLAEEGYVIDSETGKATAKQGKKIRLIDFWGGKADEAKPDGMESALRVHNLAQQNGVDEVRIDGEGIGGPIRDRIVQLSEGSYTVISVLGSSASPDRYRWGNARTYRFDKVREDMFMGKIDIDIDDKKLEAELEMIQYSYKNRWNSMQVESKDDIAKRGLKSPDFADSLVYALAADLDDLASNPMAQYRGGEKISINANDFMTWMNENVQFSPY
jgi:hypothetical protein